MRLRHLVPAFMVTFLLLTTSIASAATAAGATGQAQAGPVLARVDVAGDVRAIGLPVYAHLADERGREWALVIAPAATLEASYLAYQTLDTDASPGGYLIALERRRGARDAAAGRMPVLYDDGRQIVVRLEVGRADELAALGFAVQALPDQPLDLRAAPVPMAPFISYDSRVAAMIDQVQQDELWDDDGGLSGENPVTIGGSPYTITTRKTNSGTPIQMATQYAYERLLSLGLAVTYHTWSAGGYSSRNVVATKTGKNNPGEIVLITAHIDDTSSTSVAPGADDNGSGSVAVLDAAKIMSQFYFNRTVRFVLFTGEEQGLYGSAQYASAAAAAGDNIVAVYNMDMIAWDSVDGPTLRLHTRTPSSPGYAADTAIATTFADVVQTYGLAASLTPIIDADGITASDHASFWNHGWAAILAIEDDEDDFNTHYHQPTDLRQALNMAYFTAYVKASVGTAAHLALPTDAPCQVNTSPVSLAIDTHSAGGTSSNVNGILEPGETAMLTPAWRYPAGCFPALITGTLSAFSGPSGFTYQLPDAAASFGAMAPQEVANCFDKTGNCYALQLSNPSPRPTLHADATVTETLTYGAKKTWTLHVGKSFSDVDAAGWAYPFIETILHNNVTNGCDLPSRRYCPAASVRRDEMSAFIARALVGGDQNVPTSGTVPPYGAYDCSPTNGVSLFGDVAPTDWFCPHVHKILAAGITLGCGVDTLLYCPTQSVARGPMAVFIARALAGGETAVPLSYTDSVTGRSYNCDPASPSLHFDDVSAADWYCRHVHYLWAKGVIDGCSTGSPQFCPEPPVRREEMAKFLTNGFGLKLYGP